MRRAALCLTLVAGIAGAAQASPRHSDGTLGDGSAYAIDAPEHWNGTVLLWGHGFAFHPAATVATAPEGLAGPLLAQGYALVASSYATPGWALASAPSDQLGALAAAAKLLGQPRRVIAWGGSMGGLVTLALAERRPRAIDGALPLCGSVGGAVGMMNMALDGAVAFATLAAPDAGIRLVSVDDDRANGARVAAAITSAQATPQGRARIALAAALGGMPAWSDPKHAAPAAADFAEQEREAAAGFVFGIMLPRTGQEKLAGGVFSWNTGIDDAAQLKASGRADFVRSLYTAAGLDLDQDLRRLGAAPRIAADPAAVAYMKANYTPTGDLQVPTLSVHTIGDGLTSPTMERGYAELASRAGRARLLGQAFVDRAGHCSFSAAEYLAALGALNRRLDHGSWSLDPAALNAGGGTAYTAYTPTPFLRPCAGNAICTGEPRPPAAARHTP